MADDAYVVALKVGGAAVLGSLLTVKFIPGNWWQRATSFTGSLFIGCLVGGFAVERYGLTPGSYTHMCAVATASIFGLAIVNNGITQVPEILAALRRKVLGS